MVTVTRRVQTEDTMSVFETEVGGGYHRTDGSVEPSKAAMVGGYDLIDELLTELQKAGVQPGAKLKIRIEEVGEQK